VFFDGDRDLVTSYIATPNPGINIPGSYEREYLIRAHYNFNDVYFSFTEAINSNPAWFLVISKKLVYKISDVSEIPRKFPNLNPNARILLMINKDDSQKSADVLENEKNTVRDASLLFSSEHYEVWSIASAVDGK
jgi:hypothetical protein